MTIDPKALRGLLEELEANQEHCLPRPVKYDVQESGFYDKDGRWILVQGLENVSSTETLSQMAEAYNALPTLLSMAKRSIELEKELVQYTKQDGDVTWTSEILKDAPEGEVYKTAAKFAQSRMDAGAEKILIGLPFYKGVFEQIDRITTEFREYVEGTTTLQAENEKLRGELEPLLRDIGNDCWSANVQNHENASAGKVSATEYKRTKEMIEARMARINAVRNLLKGGE